MALMRLSPLSALCIARATFPQVLLASILPFVPNPSPESHEWQESSLFVTMPILADASLCWTLPYYNWAVKRHDHQVISSTCHDPGMYCDIFRQRSVNTESQLACRWQWTWAAGRTSYRDRSWRRMCSNNWVALFLAGQTQFHLQKDCIPFHQSKKIFQSERCPI